MRSDKRTNGQIYGQADKRTAGRTRLSSRDIGRVEMKNLAQGIKSTTNGARRKVEGGQL